MLHCSAVNTVIDHRKKVLGSAGSQQLTTAAYSADKINAASGAFGSIQIQTIPGLSLNLEPLHTRQTSYHSAIVNCGTYTDHSIVFNANIM